MASLKGNPLSKIIREAEPKGRMRYLSDDERTRLLEACQKDRDPQIYPVVMVALGTGMRQGEILTLRWGQVDLIKGTILLEHTKNDERRRVPLRGKPLEVLREHARLRRLDTDLVFPAPRNELKPVIRPHRIQPADREFLSQPQLRLGWRPSNVFGPKRNSNTTGRSKIMNRKSD